MILPSNDRIYPRWFDQVQYLEEAYQTYEFSLLHGFLPALRGAFLDTAPQGALHQVLGLAAFTLCGASRDAALTLNMLGFLALQAATFLAAWKLTRSAGIGWLAAGLLLALACPWSGGPASVVDFRLDWLAACTYGIALGCAMAGSQFRSTPWAVAFGCAVGVALLTRTLTGVYFALIFLALLLGLMAGRDRGRRGARLLLSGLVAAAIAGPVLWHKRQAIHDYYWVGHVSGPEHALRDAHLGFVRSVGWILARVFFTEVGIAAILLGLVAIGTLLALRPPAALRTGPAAPFREPARFDWGIALVFFLAPVGVLCAHPAKTSPPSTVALAPVVWLMVLGAARAARGTKPVDLTRIGAGAAAAGLVICGVLAATHRPTSQALADSRKLDAIVDYLYYRTQECGLRHPRVAVTLVSGALNADAFSVIGYERHRRWMGFTPTLPSGPFEVAPGTVEHLLEQSDFVFLLGTDDTVLPFDRQMMRRFAQTRSWCDSHLTHRADLEALGFSVSAFERPKLAQLRGHGAVDLAAMLAGPSSAAGFRAPAPPEAPFFATPPRFLISSDTEFAVRLEGAYTPVRYAASGLPDGLVLEPRSGILRGRVGRPGTYSARVAAANSAGAVSSDLVLTVEKDRFLAAVEGPPSAATGHPVDLTYQAFDAESRLDFIDITDLSTGQALERLPAGEYDHQAWQGLYRITFSQPGVRHLSFRFVRFDPDAKEPYSFVDVVREIAVAPGL